VVKGKGKFMTPTEMKDVGGKLIHLLSQQRLLYCQLHDLAQKQSGLVDGSDPEMLLRLLAGRQRIIDRLAAIDRELEPIRADWQEIAQELPAAQREEAQRLVMEVQEILGDILARDERDTKTLSHQKDQIASQIQNANKGKRIQHAYGQAVGTQASRFVDMRSE
jgi:hypothetical protein